MLEDHAADFIESSSPGQGVYGEHGAESIHKIFRLLQRTYCPIHYRLVHPDAKALKPVILKRK